MNLKPKHDYDEFLTMSRVSRNWEKSLRDYSVKTKQPNKSGKNKDYQRNFHYSENILFLTSPIECFS